MALSFKGSQQGYNVRQCFKKQKLRNFNKHDRMKELTKFSKCILAEESKKAAFVFGLD